MSPRTLVTRAGPDSDSRNSTELRSRELSPNELAPVDEGLNRALREAELRRRGRDGDLVAAAKPHGGDARRGSISGDVHRCHEASERLTLPYYSRFAALTNATARSDAACEGIAIVKTPLVSSTMVSTTLSVG